MRTGKGKGKEAGPLGAVRTWVMTSREKSGETELSPRGSGKPGDAPVLGT